MARKSGGFTLRLRLRIQRDDEIALGPGKVDLLENIAATGSIAEAAKRMDMSYMRAWTLIKTMDQCFRKPLVEPSRGGQRHGGTRLTKTGAAAVALYRKMEESGAAAATKSWQQLRRLLKS
jgi:molybdate transport system regulatory protein